MPFVSPPNAPMRFIFCSSDDHCSYNPDLFIWLGDVVYADKGLFPMVSIPASAERQEETLVAAKQMPQYQKLLAQGEKKN